MHHRWNICHIDNISTWFYISFFIHFVWTSKQQYHCNRHCYSHKWQWSIIVCVVCCITTVIRLQSYIVLIKLFYIINPLIEQNIYRFGCYNSKESKSIFWFGAKLVPTIRLILFFDLPKVIVCVIPIIYLHSFFPFFKYLIQYQLFSLPLYTFVAPVVIENGP